MLQGLKNKNANIISALEFLDYNSNEKEPTLLFVNRLDEYENGLNDYELIILDKAKIFKADAVYLRKFSDGRLPYAQIYIYDFTNKNDNHYEYAEIHRNLWSASFVPLFYVITKTEIKIFDCTEPVKIKGSSPIKTSPFEVLSLVNESKIKFDKYSFKLFDNGSFWDSETNKNRYSSKNSVYSKLIFGLKKIKAEFIQKSGLEINIAHRLLVQSILIKYLEEKKDEDGSVLKNEYFNQFEGSKNFCDVLRKKGQFVKLLNSLSQHFNGGIFECLHPDKLKNVNFDVLADLLDGELEYKRNQYVIWRLYSFNYLPIELISSIYDEFLGEEEGSVYTPAYLVNFLIDECMPVDKPQSKFSILDPSCGSGVFLVVAFKRLIQWWRIREYQKTGKLKKPSVNILQKLITDNLFGVDIKGDAIQLAAFSLSLALCDELTPKQIWNDLKFEDLAVNNLIELDFFDHIRNSSKKYDLVIGNPPFIEKIESDSAIHIIEERKNKNLPKIPQNQISLLFLEEAIKLLKDKNSKLCLLIPSGPLLYNNTLEYRKFLFNNLNILQIVDFSLIKNLFDKANYPVVSIFVSKNDDKKNNTILHVTVRRTKLSNERITFEIDYYDFHKIPKEIAFTSEHVWKSNLLGGGRIRFLIDKLKTMRTFGEYLEKMRKDNGWVYGEGYIIGEKGNKKADYITGYPTIPTDAFTETGIDKSKIYLEETTLFSCPRSSNRKIYQEPHVLIKERLGNYSIPISYVNSYLTFKHDIIGIHASRKNLTELKELIDRLKNNNTYRFFLSAVSGRSSIIRSTSTVLMKDILSLPYPEDKDDLSLDFAEKIIIDDTINYLIDYLKYGEKSKICINYVNDSGIREYGQVFCKVLNSIYAKEKFKFELGRIIKTKSFICVKFIYTDFIDKIVLGNNNEELQLENLIYNKISKDVRITRILKMYDKDSIFFIKPKQLRYWLKSIALRDADEVFNDLIIKGY